MIEERLNLAPKILPPLRHGKYRIEVSQETNIDDCKIESTKIDFNVKTDGISMSKGEVYSVYPPKDSCGTFANCLPHIVLHRRTLPWERKMREEGAPWLALLLVSEDEQVSPLTMTYGESCIEPSSSTSNKKMLIPKVSDGQDIETEEVCDTVTIPYNLFKDILPTGEDLPYLAHARGVNLDNKVTDSEVKGEWFSCIIANRYPLTSKVSEDRISHTAYLVSLEGFEEYIYNAEKRISDGDIYEGVRMYSMYSWSFQVKSNSKFDFYNLAKKLEADAFYSDVDVSDESINKLLRLGYAPMNHYFREGSNSVSWYLSPFVPQKPQCTHDIKLHFLSDELLKYDPYNGMFDISSSAAWQLGRLMALADKEFSQNILSWRLSKKSEAIRNQMNNILINKISPIQRCTFKENLDRSTSNLCQDIWRDGVERLLDTCGKTDNANKEMKLKNICNLKLNKELPKQSDILELLEDESS